jgi:hypothetical protein
MFNQLYALSQSPAEREQPTFTADFGRMCVHVKESVQVGHCDEDVLVGLRTVRNACAGVADNVAIVVESGIMEIFSHRCRCLVLPTTAAAELPYPTEDKWDKNTVAFILVGCQILANITASCRNVDFLWGERFGEVRLRDILAAVSCAQSDKALAAFIAAVYNSVQSETELSSRCLMMFCKSRALCSQLLLKILALRMDTTTTTSSTAQNPALEWMHMLVFTIVKKDVPLDWLLTLTPRGTDDAVWNNDSGSASMKKICWNEVSIEMMELGVTTEQVRLKSEVTTSFIFSADHRRPVDRRSHRRSNVHFRYC